MSSSLAWSDSSWYHSWMCIWLVSLSIRAKHRATIALYSLCACACSCSLMRVSRSIHTCHIWNAIRVLFLQPKTSWLNQKRYLCSWYLADALPEITAPPLECQANKCDGNSPPVPPSNNDSVYQLICDMQFSSIAFLDLQLSMMLFLGDEPGTRHLSQMALAICIPLTLHHIMQHHPP